MRAPLTLRVAVLIYKAVKFMEYAVTIPAHNEEKYLAKTLRCVANQTLKPDKIVVVDARTRVTVVEEK